MSLFAEIDGKLIRTGEANFVSHLRKISGLMPSTVVDLVLPSLSSASMEVASNDSWRPPCYSAAMATMTSSSASSTSLEPGSEPSLTSGPTMTPSGLDFDSATSSDVEAARRKVLPFEEMLLKVDSDTPPPPPTANALLAQQIALSAPLKVEIPPPKAELMPPLPPLPLLVQPLQPLLLQPAPQQVEATITQPPLRLATPILPPQGPMQAQC